MLHDRQESAIDICVIIPCKGVIGLNCRKTGGDNITGILCAVSAFTIWGVLPLYWKLMNNISSTEILAHRFFWAFVFTLLLVLFRSQKGEIRKVVSQRKNLFFLCAAALVICINWGTYIWAVNSNHVVETSLGYYINPLLSVLLGIVVFKEKISKLECAAVVFAFIGVSIITVQYGRIPWIALVLALSFASYGAIKKHVKINTMVGLLLETAIITPLAFVYIFIRQINGTSALNTGQGITFLLLAGAGVVTAIPLLLFSQSTRMIRLSTVGFTQYIAPTISLVLGVFVFHESFSTLHLVSFSFIWCAVFLYSYAQINGERKKRYIKTQKI